MTAVKSETMRAVQLVQYNEKFELADVPVPTLSKGDLLIRVRAAGFCHTDYQVWQGVYKSPVPLIPSHEPVGHVVAIGPEAQKTGRWKVGQRVGVLLFRHACHHCLGCYSTHDVRFCENKNMAGLMNDGGMAEYIVGDAENCVLLPDEVSFEQAAPLMCAGATTWAALMAIDIKGPAPIGVVGIGGLGSLAVQFAKALGHAVVAIDNRAEGQHLATEFGLKADLVVDTADASPANKIRSWAGNGGLAAVIVCTDDVEATNWSLTTLRPHGVAVPLGLPPSGFQFDAFTMIFSELVLKGSLVSTRDQAEDMMKVVAQHGVKSHLTVVGMDAAPQIIDMYMDPHLIGRIVMKIDS